MVLLVEGADAITNKSRHHRLAVDHGGERYHLEKQNVMNTMARRLQTYTKVLFHRHPFERLVDMYVRKSGYTNLSTLSKDIIVPLFTYVRLLGLKKYPHKSQSNATSVQPQSDLPQWKMSFSNFIKYVIHNTLLSTHPWLSLHDTCMPCVYGYDTVISWDKRETQTLALIKKLKITWPKTNLPIFKSHRRPWQKYYDSVDRGDIQSLLQMYGNDMDMFNYTWPTLWLHGSEYLMDHSTGGYTVYVSLTTGPVTTYWARNWALVFWLWLASLNLIQFGGVTWRFQSHWSTDFRDTLLLVGIASLEWGCPCLPTLSIAV